MSISSWKSESGKISRVQQWGITQKIKEFKIETLQYYKMLLQNQSINQSITTSVVDIHDDRNETTTEIMRVHTFRLSRRFSIILWENSNLQLQTNSMMTDWFLNKLTFPLTNRLGIIILLEVSFVTWIEKKSLSGWFFLFGYWLTFIEIYSSNNLLEL